MIVPAKLYLILENVLFQHENDGKIVITFMQQAECLKGALLDKFLRIITIEQKAVA